MRRKIWTRPSNPTERIARTLGISRPELRYAIHRIKKNAKLRPSDNVSIWDDGSVTDDNDVWIGNIHDET
jgi:hypothetical protein